LVGFVQNTHDYFFAIGNRQGTYAQRILLAGNFDFEPAVLWYAAFIDFQIGKNLNAARVKLFEAAVKVVGIEPTSIC
jgi:hypothetical protein